MHYEFKEEDIYDFARSRGLQTKDRGDEIQFKRCPYCNGGEHRRDLGTFSVNRKTGQFECKRSSCGVKGNLITLAKDFDFRLSDDFSKFYRKRETYKNLPQPKKVVKASDQAAEWLKSRGISKETADKYQITTKKDNKDVLCFLIYNAEGKLVNVKYRNLKFTKDKKNGIKEWFEEGCLPYLYGVNTWNGKYDRMYLTEGQMDALALSECGLENCFSVPGGVKGWTWWPSSYDFVSKFSEIVVVGDYEKGHITLLDDIKLRFKGRIKHLKESDYKDCKDANELLLKYGAEDLRQCAENAVTLPIDCVIQAADVEYVDIFDLEKVPTGIKSLDFLLFGGLPFGGYSVITAKSGIGKSTLASQILVSAIDKGFKCYAYSGELPNYLFKAWMNYQVAGSTHIFDAQKDEYSPVKPTISKTNINLISEWYRDKLWMYDNDKVNKEDRVGVLDAMENAILQYGVRVILIDNLMTAVQSEMKPGMNKYDVQSEFADRLRYLGRKYNVCIILVAHKKKGNKDDSDDENDDISGTADITNLAMLTLSYNRDPMIADNQRLLKLLKNRVFGRTCLDGLLMNFDPRSRRTYGEDDDPNYEINFGASEDKAGDFTDGFMQTDKVPDELVFD